MPRPHLPFVFFCIWIVIIAMLPFAAKPALTFGAGILALIAGIFLFHQDRNRNWPKGLALALLAIVVLTGVSSVWSANALDVMCSSLRLAIAASAGVILMTAAQSMPLPKPFVLQVLTFSVVCAILTLITFQMTGFAVHYWWFDGSRLPTSTMLNKATGALTLLLPPLCVLATQGRSRPAIYFAILPVLLFFWLTISESQSSLLAFFVMIAASLMPIASTTMWKGLRVIITGGLIAAPWLANALFSLAPDIKNISMLASASIPQRLEVWQAFAKEIFKHPFIGQGLDAADRIKHLEIDEIYQRGIAFTHPHNMALQIWLEFGVLGIMMAATFLILLLRKIEQEQDLKIRRLYLCAFLPPFVVAQIGWGMWQMWWVVLMFLIATLTLFAARHIRQNKTPA